MSSQPTCPACGAPIAAAPDGGLMASCGACGKTWIEQAQAKPNVESDAESNAETNIEVAVVVVEDPVMILEPVVAVVMEVEAPIIIDEPAIEAQVEPEPVFLSLGPVEDGPGVAQKLAEGPWFLETPEGLRFGPANCEEISQWVAEGRVSLDCRLKASPGLDLSPGDFFPGLKVPPRRANSLPGMRPVVHLPKKPPPPEKKPATETVVAPKPGELTFRANHRGYWVLLLAICSWAACPLLGISAWLMATHDLREMEAGRMDAAGEPDTALALWLGMTHAIVSAVFLVIGLIAGALVLALR